MPRSVLIHGPCHVAASGKVSTRGNTVIRLLSSDGPDEIAACDAPPILVLIVVQDKRLHDVWVLLGYGIPAIKRLETGMITSRCYILELHARLRSDNTLADSPRTIERSHYRREAVVKSKMSSIDKSYDTETAVPTKSNSSNAKGSVEVQIDGETYSIDAAAERRLSGSSTFAFSPS